MYCWLCGATGVKTCASCSRHVCNRHLRRWFRVAFCTRCRAALPPPWTVTAAGAAVGAALVYFFI
jgi:hypothetical protein